MLCLGLLKVCVSLALLVRQGRHKQIARSRIADWRGHEAWSGFERNAVNRAESVVSNRRLSPWYLARLF